MTNFYPFYLSNMYGGSLDLEAVAYSYKITLTATTNAPSKANAFLEFDKNGTAFQKLAFDVHTNVGTPIVIHVEANTYCRINLWGRSGPSHGSYGTYFIEPEAITIQTTANTATSPPRTSPGPTVLTTHTKAPTTTTLTTTVVSTAAAGPTGAPRTPKAAVEVYFLVVTVFSMLFLSSNR